MSKKKTSQKKNENEAEAAAEDATFEAEQDQPDSPDDTGAGPVRESAGQEESASEMRTTDRSPQRKGGGFVAWLALLVASLALAAFGYDYIRDRSAEIDSREGEAAIAAVNSSVGALRDSIAALQQGVTALTDRLSRHDGTIDRIASDLGERLQQIESLRSRVSTIEGNVASLQGISSGTRDAWLLAEAEYYMQIANAQLQLAGNPQLASVALGHADERILQLANPALTGVRRALSNELRALQAMDKPDTAGVTLTLASLATRVGSMPLRQEIARRDSTERAVDPELSGTDRALASLRSAFASVVSVRRTDEALKPLIAPEAQYFLRANLALQLQAARLAVLRGEEGIFRQSLDDAAAWINEYYDTASGPVQSALQSIAEVRRSVFSVAVPDISESLRLLRQYNALADRAVTPVVEPIDEPVDAPVAEPPQ